MNNDKSVLGLHIDDDCLNIVALKQTANGLRVDNWTAEPLKAGVIKDGLIVDEQVVSQKIRNFVKANQLKSCKVVISLPCSTVRLKPSEFPAQADKQLKKQVEEQIGKYSLFEGQEVIFDYCVFEETAQFSNKQTVLQAVTTRQMSDACLTVAQRSGLDLVRIEPAVMPIIKFVFYKQAADSQAVSLLLTLDSASGNLSVFKNGLPQLCQNLSVGTKDLLQGKNGFARLTEQMKPVLEFAHSIADSQQLVLRIVAACNVKKLKTITEKIRQSLSNVTIEQIDCSQIAKEYDIQDIDGAEVPIFPFARFSEFLTAAREAGANPYCVYMGWNPASDFKKVATKGFDAVSAYAKDGNQPKFADLARAVEQSYWHNVTKSQIPYIPLVTTGWDKRPRKDNPVSWEKGHGYHQQDVFPSRATPAEISAHLKNALSLVQKYPRICEANAVIVYAWNEYDEGGWLSPSRGADGTPDISRLDAVRQILKDSKVQE